MDKFEFQEKAECKITDDEYQMVERVYMNCPENIVGGYVTEFCKWFNANGKMKAIEMMYPVAIAFEKMNAEITSLKSDLATANHDVEIANKGVEEMKQTIRTYEMLVTDEMVDEAVSKIDRRQKLRLISECWTRVE